MNVGLDCKNTAILAIVLSIISLACMALSFVLLLQKEFMMRGAALNQCYHYIGFSVFDTHLAFTGKPTESCINFFFFELCGFLQSLNTKFALFVKCSPYQSGPVSNDFYVHNLN